MWFLALGQELELVQELAQLVLVWVQQEQVLALQERVQLVLDLELQQALVAEWVLVLALVRLEPEELQAARPRQELAREQEWVELEATLRVLDLLVLELVRRLQELEPEVQEQEQLEQPQKVTRQVSKGLRQLPLQLPMASESLIPYKI